MSDSFDFAASQTVTDAPDVPRTLAARVDRVLAAAGDAALPRLVRVTLAVAPVDAFRWLQAQDLYPRLYWAGRDDAVQFAAVGAADVCRGDGGATYDTLRTHLDRMHAQSDPEARYFGGFRFDGAAASAPEWRAFGTYQFTLPRFELRLEGEEARLTCNLVLPRDAARRSALRAAVGALAFPMPAPPEPLPLPTSRTDGPDEAGWRRNVEWALRAFEETTLEKVVLARRAVFRFGEPLDPLALIRRLRAATFNCFHFCFQPEAGTAFVGASPERLFERRGRSVRTEAVAGTRPRGASEEADARLRDELLHSEKERREHEYVRRSIHEQLLPLSASVDVGDVREMTLARGRHLYAAIRGRLRADVLGSDVMYALHPTPAVGGYPTPEALAAIRELEPFDRGWYAGPVGWIGPEGAEFAVAIRCGLVEPDRLSLYSGAGIVRGSTPEAEWQEIEHKIGDFIQVLGLDVRYAK